MAMVAVCLWIACGRPASNALDSNDVVRVDSAEPGERAASARIPIDVEPSTGRSPKSRNERSSAHLERLHRSLVLPDRSRNDALLRDVANLFDFSSFAYRDQRQQEILDKFGPPDDVIGDDPWHRQQWIYELPPRRVRFQFMDDFLQGIDWMPADDPQ